MISLSKPYFFNIQIEKICIINGTESYLMYINVKIVLLEVTIEIGCSNKYVQPVY